MSENPEAVADTLPTKTLDAMYAELAPDPILDAAATLDDYALALEEYHDAAPGGEDYAEFANDAARLKGALSLMGFTDDELASIEEAR